VRSADYSKKISAVLAAADEDKIGKHAPNARAQLTTAAAAATAASEAAKRGADALEVSYYYCYCYCYKCYYCYYCYHVLRVHKRFAVLPALACSSCRLWYTYSCCSISHSQFSVHRSTPSDCINSSGLIDLRQSCICLR
jgi:hypothetical protein